MNPAPIGFSSWTDYSMRTMSDIDLYRYLLVRGEWQIERERAKR